MSRQTLSWRDPASVIVLALVGLLGALLLTDRPVPDLLGTLLVAALAFLFGSHSTQTAQSNMLDHLNGNSATALSNQVAAVKLAQATTAGTPGGRRATDPAPTPPDAGIGHFEMTS